jgi:hypothetical protein
MRSLAAAIAVLCSWALLPAPGATLEKLSLDEMIEKSSIIVRARAGESRSVRRGPVIYTLTSLEVLDRWKGSDHKSLEVAIPGGFYADLRQEFSGAPALKRGSEYVFFLWTGKSGAHHIIGLSQGLFTLARDNKGNLIVHRAASDEIVIDPKTGRSIQDLALTLDLSELKRRVERSLGAVK